MGGSGSRLEGAYDLPPDLGFIRAGHADIELGPRSVRRRVLSEPRYVENPALWKGVNGSDPPKVLDGLNLMKDMFIRRKVAKRLGVFDFNSPLLHGAPLRMPPQGGSGRKRTIIDPMFSDENCSKEGLNSSYAQFRIELDKAMEASLRHHVAGRCASCGARYFDLQRAKELSNFLERSDNSTIEDHELIPPKQYRYPPDLGRWCNSTLRPCPAKYGPTDCHKGRCLCKLGYVMVEKGATVKHKKCLSARGEIDGLVVGDLERLDGTEVSRLGNALAAVQNAAVDMKGREEALFHDGEVMAKLLSKDKSAPSKTPRVQVPKPWRQVADNLDKVMTRLEGKQAVTQEVAKQEVPEEVIGHIKNAQMLMRDVAAQAMRCRTMEL